MNREEETIPGLLIRAASIHAERPAIVDEGVTTSYRDLLGRVLRAGALLSSVGVRRGDRVAIWLPNGSDFIEVAFAVMALGAAVVPLSTRLKGGEAAYILRAARPAALIAAGTFLGVNYGDLIAPEDVPVMARFRVGAGRQDWSDWREAVASVEEARLDAVSASMSEVRGDDVAEVMFTSGTTGFPKGTLLLHRQIVQTYRIFTQKLGVTSDDRYLIIAPMFHSYGFKAGVLISLIAGAASYPMATFDVGRALEIIERERITITGGPPTIFLSLLKENAELRHDLSSLRSVSTGGSMVPATMIRALQALGVETVLNAYGLTETCALVTITEPDEDPEIAASTSGRVIDGVAIRCADLEGRSVPTGEQGEIQVRGFNVTPGYFENDEATRQATTEDGWFRTGDIGVLDESGYLRVTDRMKDMFIVGGFNCYPAEIERLIMDHGSIDQVSVVGVPDDRMGEVAKAFVVPKSGITLDVDVFIAWCREHMANYKVPRHVEVVAALPRNAMGKVQKFILRDPKTRA